MEHQLTQTSHLTPSPLFQSVIDAWSSFSSACLGSCPRFKASHWKGLHLLPLFKFLCVALPGTLYSQTLGLCIIIHVRDQKGVLMGNRLTQLPGTPPHVSTGMPAPKLPPAHSWYSFVLGADMLPISRLSTSIQPEVILPRAHASCRGAEQGTHWTHLGSFDFVGSSLTHIDFMGLAKSWPSEVGKAS